MGTIVASAQCLQRKTDGLIVLIHHTGKDRSRGQRGHSSLLAALDASIEVRNSPHGRVWVADKVKDGASGHRGAFDLRPIKLGDDSDGDAVTSCVVVEGASHPDRQSTLSGRRQREVWEAITKKYKAGDIVSDALFFACAEQALAEVPRARARSREVVDALVRLGYVKRLPEGFRVATEVC